ncbi:hypothetical protein KSP40_PGU002120 [Platanthera guangdongensis]|uniref:E3 ubiquitin-protein ligase RMA n=1 Tax=Platanthera guangdongensis TaxID=2320717 RepID=A0ABR2LFB2_9ASPA
MSMTKYFICKICYIVAEDPVMTQCQHLFCRHCLSAWLYSHSINFECPVCKDRIQANDITWDERLLFTSLYTNKPNFTPTRAQSRKTQY